MGEEFPLTVERRMISSSLGEADDWLTRFKNVHITNFNFKDMM